MELCEEVGLECELVGDVFDGLQFVLQLLVDVLYILGEYAVDFFPAHAAAIIKYNDIYYVCFKCAVIDGCMMARCSDDLFL